MQPRPTATSSTSLGVRINLWYALILFIMAVFLMRLFYLQIMTPFLRGEPFLKIVVDYRLYRIMLL